MQISEVSAQLRANYQHCDNCGRELLQAADAVDIMEAALKQIADMDEPSLPSEYADCARIARKALETRL